MMMSEEAYDTSDANVEVSIQALAENDPEADAETTRDVTLAKKGPRERSIFLEWHRRFGAEADRIARSIAKDDSSTFAIRPREVATLKAWRALTTKNSNVEITLLAVEVLPPEDVLRGLASIFAANAPTERIKVWAEAIARIEARWCAAFVAKT